MGKTHPVGELQLAILRRLWERGEATVNDVHADLQNERGLAPTTIATMLKKMEARGLVRHRAEGRRFIYRPAVSEPHVTHSMVSDLTDRLFGGRVSHLVGHLLAEHEIDAEELAELQRLVADADKKERM
jgi:predicted transcriptional regulator